MRDLDCLDIENASKANQASETPTESPQPEQDQPEWQARLCPLKSRQTIWRGTQITESSSELVMVEE
ncbi:hypothetical protein PC128_g18377 [Phytophthora cactorum]|nr:hypothetical protein PC128_g18377 [Phytophthora cactorum]